MDPLATRKATTRLTADEIDVSRMLDSIEDPAAGAVVVFLGKVRNHSEAGAVERVEYEAYAPMVERRLAQTEDEVRRRWPATRAVRIAHRVGDLKVGDVSVAVVVSSPHRAEAFEACRYAIETIKHDVPIWKREKLANGNEVWVEGTSLQPSGATTNPSSRAGRQKGKTSRTPGRRNDDSAAAVHG